MNVLSGGAVVIGAGELSLVEGTRRFRRPISSEIGARDIAQTVSVYSPGVAPARRNPVAEEVLYVVRGKGSCFIGGHTYELEPATAVYIPPETIYQVKVSDGELEVVGVCCPEDSGAQAGLENLVDEAGETKPFRTVREGTQAAIPTGDRTFKLLIDRALGAQRVTQFIGVIPPSRAPMHHHGYEEAIYILEGNGVVWTDSASAVFSPGSSIYLPRGVSHCLENTGASVVRLLGVFHPSGNPGISYND